MVFEQNFGIDGLRMTSIYFIIQYGMAYLLKSTSTTCAVP